MSRERDLEEHLSKDDLLEHSDFLRRKISQREYEYRSKYPTPYMEYKNQLGKEAVFHPDLFFDPLLSEDSAKQTVYRISLVDVDYDFKFLEILYNLLAVQDPGVATGYWLVGYYNKKLCGWGITNLKKTIGSKVPNYLRFVIGCQYFVCLFQTAFENHAIRQASTTFYLSRHDLPYIDIVDLLNGELSPLLRQYDIAELPRGKEICSDVEPRWLGPSLEISRLKLRTVGTIDVRDPELDMTYPSIVICEPVDTQSILSKIRPWFVTCAGGFGLGDISESRRFGVNYFSVLSLPELDLITLVLV